MTSRTRHRDEEREVDALEMLALLGEHTLRPDLRSLLSSTAQVLGEQLGASGVVVRTQGEEGRWSGDLTPQPPLHRKKTRQRGGGEGEGEGGGGGGGEVNAGAEGTARIAGGTIEAAGFVFRGGEGSGGGIEIEGSGIEIDARLERWLGAAARIIATGVRQVDRLRRVATLSRRAHEEREQLRDEVDRGVLPDGAIAVSAGMRRVFLDVAPRVARLDTTVLLRGESGTGKEVLARRIHALSRRASRPFLKVNCGALAPSLVESALFGHERGAFSGAIARHVGWFERAHDGTILLDEIAELPLGAQVKLLRVLQEGELERVGGEKTLRVNVRVIAATHRDLEAMIAAGQLREDLFYRLAVFPIVLPPLRERTEDIPALAEAIVTRLARTMARPCPTIPRDVMRALLEYGWPGNVRELENVLERAVILSSEHELSLEGVLQPGAPSNASPTDTTRTGETLRTASIRCIRAALAASGGKMHGPGGAAERLGIKPTTLYSKMKRLGIR